VARGENAKQRIVLAQSPLRLRLKLCAALRSA
jgi:hypothetical protein